MAMYDGRFGLRFLSTGITILQQPPGIKVHKITICKFRKSMKEEKISEN
jgi:hypothetical protein